MRTLYTLTLLREDGGTTIVDYLDELGWQRHEFDRPGRYRSVSGCGAEALDALREEATIALVHELRKAAGALDEALGELGVQAALRTHLAPDPGDPLGAPWAGRLRDDRRDVLQRLAQACADGWSEAVSRLAQAPADDHAGIARAARAINVMSTSRELAVQALAQDAAAHGSR